ncbi:LuxR family transcriptional regulator [Paucimonas lemoignei]|uniref:LuxR family transcriptional regulator n=1 Tax=Paucimonas lemoignei TaxID=29443 RepID=A0A4R3HX56_PAULE|nr:helix-turn-helix transcriptional regulator [Paucimonas lemoignei]TCS37394.1 LuxR family transcriptional regulator [Paucimonas lemoignei]
MQAFSRTLIDLYHVAENASLQRFPEEVLRLLQPWIDFDGAVFGMGESQTEAQANLQIVHAHIHNRDASLLADYETVSATDPVTGAFLAGLASPMPVDCQAVYANRQHEQVDAFAHKHQLRHLMLYGDAPSAERSGRWLVLYRSDNRAFQELEADLLHAAWFHVSRAVDINRAVALDRQDPQHARRASALVNPRGLIEAADPQFHALLEHEWPSGGHKSLPQPLLDSAERGQPYRGRRIEVTMRREDAWLVCVACAIEQRGRLTPGEYAVARRFAAGMSNKEIARELGVSPHTVRSQLSNAYAKLDVHDKAELAQRLMTLSP